MMQENNNPLDHLERVYEMNRLFLSFLQLRARRRADCLGLPGPIAVLFRTASDAQLDRAAALPQALFRLNLERRNTADAPMERTSKEATDLYCLQISLLQGARNLCRRSSHLARTFLSLPASSLIRLRCLALLELTGVAESSQLVRASFSDEPWLWNEVLSSQAAGEQRQLRLLALQPRAGDLATMPAPSHSRIR